MSTFIKSSVTVPLAALLISNKSSISTFSRCDFRSKIAKYSSRFRSFGSPLSKST